MDTQIHIHVDRHILTHTDDIQLHTEMHICMHTYMYTNTTDTHTYNQQIVSKLYKYMLELMLKFPCRNLKQFTTIMYMFMYMYIRVVVICNCHTFDVILIGKISGGSNCNVIVIEP